MGQDFKETAHNKTDKKKYDENYDSIDWGDLKEKPLEKKNNPKKHPTSGLCGEYGMSVVDEKAFKENFDNIDWSKKPKDMSDQELLDKTKNLLEELENAKT